MGRLTPTQRYRHLAICVCMVAACVLLGACGRAEGTASFEPSPLSQSPTATHAQVIPSPIAGTDTPLSTPFTPVIATGVPTYVYYRQVVEATAYAIMLTLPTPSPVPDRQPTRQAIDKHDYLVDIAMRTAVAMYPPPPGYDPSSEFTPEVEPPMPTEPPIPYIAAQNGRLYNRSLEDNPIGKMLGQVNHWRGQIAVERIGAYAGHHYQDPTKGVLLVVSPNPQDSEISLYQYYLTSGETGALRIISETAGRFTLQAADGSTHVFDLSTRQWVNP